MKVQISDTHLQVTGQITYVSDISGIHCPKIQMKYLVSGNLSVSVSARALVLCLTRDQTLVFVATYVRCTFMHENLQRGCRASIVSQEILDLF